MNNNWNPAFDDYYYGDDPDEPTDKVRVRRVPYPNPGASRGLRTNAGRSRRAREDSVPRQRPWWGGVEGGGGSFSQDALHRDVPVLRPCRG